MCLTAPEEVTLNQTTHSGRWAGLNKISTRRPNMLKWVKKLFGTEQPAQTVTIKPAEEELKTTVAAVTVKTETKKPAEKKTAPKKTDDKKSATKTAKHTRANLEKLNKTQIEALAKAELGVDLDRRKTKEFMIDDFLAAQKK